MPTADSLKQALEHYRGLERQLLGDLQGVRLMIARLERDSGESPSNPDMAVNIGDSLPPMGSNVEVTMNGRKPEIRPDEFFGMTQAEAARKYLKKIGHAISFDDLVVALSAGGCKVGGGNPKKVLYISLVRNTRDFVPPQQGYIGLREFYPGGGGAVRPQKEKIKKARNKPKGRRTKAAKTKAVKSTKASTTPKVAKTRTPSPLAGAIRSFLGDKQLHTVEEILSAVTTKLGQPVKKIGVLGVVTKSKDIEKVDGKYRLVK